MNPLMEKLHDIEGIDPVSLWPLGIGWWVVIGCSLILIIFISWYFYRMLAYKRSWKNDALLQLKVLESNVSEKTTTESAILLSEYLRRIAIHLYSRRECAGLTGSCWLKWLSANDPKKFDWEKKGRDLFEAPYAPDTISISKEEIKELIQATKRWVK